MRDSRRARNRRALIRYLIARDGPNCAWCGQPLGANLDALEADHIVPASAVGWRIRLGLHTTHHFQVLHSRCNARKGDGGPDFDFGAACRQVQRNREREATVRKAYRTSRG